MPASVSHLANGIRCLKVQDEELLCGSRSRTPVRKNRRSAKVWAEMAHQNKPKQAAELNPKQEKAGEAAGLGGGRGQGVGKGLGGEAGSGGEKGRRRGCARVENGRWRVREWARGPGRVGAIAALRVPRPASACPRRAWAEPQEPSAACPPRPRRASPPADTPPPSPVTQPGRLT